MSKFTERMFAMKSAYSFEKQENDSLVAWLLTELTNQLRDLEAKWMQLDADRMPAEPKSYQYKVHIEKLLFRLEEVNRLITDNKGPKIISFVCLEILDYLREKQLHESGFSTEQVDSVGVVLIVMSAFLNSEILDLDLITVEEISEQLKKSIAPLRKREAPFNIK